MKDSRRPLRRLCCVLISIAFIASVAHSQSTPPAKTQINDVIYRADGTPASGTILISWPAFTTADGKAVAAGNMAVKIGAAGSVQLALAPNAGATPTGTFYKATLKLNDGTTNVEYWTVPASDTTTIAAIRSVLVPASTSPLPLAGDYVKKAGDYMSGPLNVSMSISAPRIEKIRFADQFPGSDAGQKIAAAIGDLPASGGTVDARALEGPQTISATLTITKPVRILLGASTISHTVDAFVIAGDGVQIEGLGTATILKPSGSASLNSVRVQGSSGNPLALATDAKEGDTSVTLVSGGVAALGLQAGDYISIADAEKQQIQKVRQISGNTVMLADFVFRAVAASGSAVRKLVMIRNARIGNFRLDGSANSGTSNAISLNFCADCTVHDVVADNNTGLALSLDTGYGNTFLNIVAHNAGRADIQTGAMLSSRQTQATYDNINFFEPASWGAVWTLNFASTMSNVNVTSNGRQQTGRGVKFSSSSYNRTTNVGETGFAAQNFILEQGSSSNQFTNCYALGNGMFDNGGGAMGGAGINTFGNGNNHNRFVNCTAKFNGGAQIGIGNGDNYNSIIGGEYCCNRASGTTGTIQTSGDYTTILGAEIWTDSGLGSPHTGIAFQRTGMLGQMIVGNKLHGFAANYDMYLGAGVLTDSIVLGNEFPDGISGYDQQSNTAFSNNLGVPNLQSGLNMTGSQTHYQVTGTDWEAAVGEWVNGNYFLHSKKNGNGTPRSLTIGTATTANFAIETAGSQRWVVDTAGHLWPLGDYSVGTTAHPISALVARGCVQIGASGGPTWCSGSSAPVGVCTNGSLYSNTTTGKLAVCEGSVWVTK